MDQQIQIFGEQMTSKDLVSLIVWTLRNRLFAMTRHVKYRYRLDDDDILSEAVLLILHSSNHPKWQNNPPSVASTAIVNCTYYALQRLRRGKVIPTISESQGETNWLAQLVQPSNEPTSVARDVFDCLPEMIRPRLASLILARYRDGNDMGQMADKWGVTRQRIQQLETEALDVLRCYRLALCGRG